MGVAAGYQHAKWVWQLLSGWVGVAYLEEDQQVVFLSVEEYLGLEAGEDGDTVVHLGRGGGREGEGEGGREKGREGRRGGGREGEGEGGREKGREGRRGGGREGEGEGGRERSLENIFGCSIALHFQHVDMYLIICSHDDTSR